MKRQLFLLLLLTAAVFTTALNAAAQTPAQNPATPAKPAAPPAPHDHTHMSKTPEKSSAAEKYFTDVELIDQDGKKVRIFRSSGKVIGAKA